MITLFMRFLFLIGLLGLSSITSIACADPYWDLHAQGWHWYEVDPNVSVQSAPSSPPLPGLSSSDPMQQMQAVQKVVDEAKAAAVLSPTPENIKHYIEVQNAVTQNAAQFSRVWQQVIWQDPGLNYSLSHPTNQLAQEAYLDVQRGQESQKLKHIAKKYGLFFFFSSQCPYCHKFAPTIKSLQKIYDFSVIPITLDGGGLPDYPHPRPDQGQARKFNVTQWPAVFLVNPQTRQVIPITYGLISQDELTHRIVILVTQLEKQGIKTT